MDPLPSMPWSKSIGLFIPKICRIFSCGGLSHDNCRRFISSLALLHYSVVKQNSFVLAPCSILSSTLHKNSLMQARCLDIFFFSFFFWGRDQQVKKFVTSSWMSGETEKILTYMTKPSFQLRSLHFPLENRTLTNAEDLSQDLPTLGTPSCWDAVEAFIQPGKVYYYKVYFYFLRNLAVFFHIKKVVFVMVHPWLCRRGTLSALGGVT